MNAGFFQRIFLQIPILRVKQGLRKWQLASVDLLHFQQRITLEAFRLLFFAKAALGDAAIAITLN